MNTLRRIVESNPVPDIFDEELVEKVFTHRSLFPMSAHLQVAPEEPKDWERLAFLGDQILAMCTTELVYERYATARTSYLTTKRNYVVNNDQVARWSWAYGFPRRIRAAQSQQTVIQTGVKFPAAVFEAYIGAVYEDSGYQRVIAWIKPLIRAALDESDAKERDQERYSGDDASELTTQEEQYEIPTMHELNISRDERDEAYDESRSLSPSDSLSQAGIRSPNRAGSNTPKAQNSSLPRSFSEFGTPDPTQSFYHSNQLAEMVSRPNHPSSLKFRPDGGPSTVASLPNSSPRKQELPTKTSPFVRSLDASSSYSSSPSNGSSGNSASSKGSPSSVSSRTTSTVMPGSGYLALFNQIATQKHLVPQWHFTSSGPAHKPVFNAKLSLYDQLQGQGTAYSKQNAKHIAAKQALLNLGWSIEHAVRVTTRQLFFKRDKHRLWVKSTKARKQLPLSRLASFFRASFRRGKPR